jgi:putative FmdB family regulatory protein
MPIYDYQCYGCGLNFEKSVNRKNREKPQKCLSCGQESEPINSSFNYGFNIEATAPVPQNTGVSEYDMMVDRVIGKSAEEGRKVIEKRDRDKRDLLRGTGKKKKDLSRNADGTYSFMDKRHQEISENVRAFNMVALSPEKDIFLSKIKKNNK